jgi:hypothetical protein
VACGSSSRRLTIVGGVRERPTVALRRRGDTVCAGVAHRALLGGPSTSPLADMAYPGVKRSSIYAAACVSLMLATYVGWALTHNLEPTEPLFALYRLVLTVLFATWLIADARESGRARPTFDYGWFIVFGFVVYVPYYLFSTRRWRGLLILLGMLLIFILPPVLGALVAAMYVS